MQRSTMQDAISAPSVGGIVRLTRFILRGTLILELLGALAMLPVFCRDYGWRGVWKNEKMVQMPQLLFYVENKSGEDLSVYTSGTTLNGADSNADIWVDLPPCSKTVTPCLCTDLFFDSQEDIHSISTTLHYTVGDLAEFTQNVTVALN